MYNTLSLSLKCPHCSKSLMDSEVLVDNEASIALQIEITGTKGKINLSSIYGSFNYSSAIENPVGSIAVFSCLHCGKDIKSSSLCKLCNAPMASLVLDIGGKVSFCTRSGCQNHTVEIEDLDNALRKFHQVYGFESSLPERKPGEIHTHVHVDEDLEIIEAGTFLQAYCPHCRKSLIEAEMLKLKLVNDKNESGDILLSPYLNVFSAKSTLFLTEGKPVGDLRCFHCDHTLMVEDKQCDSCGSPVCGVSISARSKLIDFFICSKKGCRWHGLSEEDINNIKLDESLEW